jgi:hypothetical protein
MSEKAAQSNPSPIIRPAFYFDGKLVGYFEQQDFPRVDGVYRYMPCRGLGHYAIQMALQHGENPRCSYREDGAIASFVVRKGHECATLELFDFQDLRMRKS